MAVLMIRLMVFFFIFLGHGQMQVKYLYSLRKMYRENHVNHKVFISLSCYNIFDIVMEIHEQSRIPISLYGGIGMRQL